MEDRSSSSGELLLACGLYALIELRPLVLALASPLGIAPYRLEA